MLALHEEQLDPSLHTMKMKNVCLLHPRSESPRLARAERGEFCSRSPDRIGVAAGPSWAGPTAPIPSEAVGRAVRQRQWAAGGRQRRERRLTAAEHAARGGVRRRERVARIAPRLAKKPGRPAACLCDVCVTVADELRACAALSNLFMD